MARICADLCGIDAAACGLQIADPRSWRRRCAQVGATPIGGSTEGHSDGSVRKLFYVAKHLRNGTKKSRFPCVAEAAVVVVVVAVASQQRGPPLVQIELQLLQWR